MSTLRPLEWFPKRFSAGDMAGQGAQRLLGQPDLSTWELLVRETAQNSWDARLEGVVPRYEMHLRTLDEATQAALRLLFIEGSTDLGLTDALSRPGMRVVEINDRGTRGLGGPVRNDLVAHGNAKTDFADFVLTLGAPRDNEFGGGTYGFGKTAAYTASSCGTVVIWSRTQHEGRLEHRFIASAFGPTFEIDGFRYTGRHWWGLRIDDTIVEPVVGDEAREWGETLFSLGFEEDETGTSLLILAPRMPDDAPDATASDVLVEAWRAAVVRNLWPKFIPGQPADRTMDITIRQDGGTLQLVSAGEEKLLAAQARAITAVRKAQDGSAPDPDLMATVIPVERQRPHRLLGHLALVPYTPASIDKPGDTGTGNARDGRDALTLMRHEAELVVRNTPRTPLSTPPLCWTGVFKPVKELDAIFAMAEPPSHDDWNPSGLESNERRDVRYALQKISEAIQQFVDPRPVGAHSTDGVPAGAISTALAGLAGSAAGGRAHRPEKGDRATRTGVPRRAGEPGVKILHWEPRPITAQQAQDGRQSIRVTMLAQGDSPRLTISPSSLGLGTEGQSIPAHEELRVRWVDDQGMLTEADSVVVATGNNVIADIEFPAGLAIEFSFQAKVHP